MLALMEHVVTIASLTCNHTHAVLMVQTLQSVWHHNDIHQHALPMSLLLLTWLSYNKKQYPVFQQQMFFWSCKLKRH